MRISGGRSESSDSPWRLLCGHVNGGHDSFRQPPGRLQDIPADCNEEDGKFGFPEALPFAAGTSTGEVTVVCAKRNFLADLGAT